MKKNEGFTLIELIISLGILSIVALGAYSLFGFGNRTYYNGTDQYDIQANIRIAKEYITNQLKYASNITIYSAVPKSQDEMDAYDNYIYYDEASNSVVHLNRFFEKKFNLGPADKPGAASSITFKSKDPYKNLYFNIDSHNNNQKYKIENTIDLLNLHLSINPIVGGTPAADDDGVYWIIGNVIEFQSPSDYLSSTLKPTVTESGPIPETEFIIKFNYNLNKTEMNSSSILTNENFANPIISIPSDNQLEITFDSKPAADAQLFIQVKFSDIEVYDDTYIYIIDYNIATDTWTVH